MDKNDMIKELLWNLVTDKTYIDESNPQYSDYIKKLVENQAFLLKEFISLAQKMNRVFTIQEWIGLFKFIANLREEEIESFLNGTEETDIDE